MAFWTYILRCADGQYYTGHTDNLERRVGEHQTGAIKGFTSSKLPVILVWSEYFQTRLEAIEAELRIKKWSKAKKEALAEGDWNAVSYFAKPPKERLSEPPGVSTTLDTNGERGGDPRGERGDDPNGERGDDPNGERGDDPNGEDRSDTSGFESSASPKPFVSYFAKPPKERLSKPPGVSTTLDTNGDGGGETLGFENATLPKPFVSSEVETPISQNHPVDAKPHKCP